ncbi:hypothetical protein P43SY_007289 [Pythium insidiosum]|uniref:Uncharacterized protein n=1 Tax=Pythium insidiosum TaxID=114742 RepID=A0AAD5LVH7_PYTIN|nr:hypothetical protein P43SY_007289 [Pythium insidiosum]
MASDSEVTIIDPPPAGTTTSQETALPAMASPRTQRTPAARVATPAEGEAENPGATRADVDKMRSELSSVRNEVSEVRQLLAQLVALQQPTESTPRRTEEAETHSTATFALEPAPVPSVRTQPNAKGEFPPEPVRNLSSDTFAFEGKKVKGNYYPPKVHSLAAHRMFKDLDLLSGHGKYSSPTDLVLAIPELECVKFQASPALAMALLSGRLSSCGASIMMFKEVDDASALELG